MLLSGFSFAFSLSWLAPQREPLVWTFRSCSCSLNYVGNKLLLLWLNIYGVVLILMSQSSLVVELSRMLLYVLMNHTLRLDPRHSGISLHWYSNSDGMLAFRSSTGAWKFCQLGIIQLKLQRYTTTSTISYYYLKVLIIALNLLWCVVSRWRCRVAKWSKR